MGIEKVQVGLSMSTRWTDPPMMLIAMIPYVIGLLLWALYFLYSFNLLIAFAPHVVTYVLWNYVYHKPEPANPEKYVIFKTIELKKMYKNQKIPMVEFYEHFIEGEIELRGDCLEILKNHRNEFLNYRTTVRQLRWLIEQFVPSKSSSFKGKAETKKEIADHYDRGNDFFAAFLGKSMVYTSGFFNSLSETLEQAQFNKMSLICDKIQLKKGETLLDIGCGWGTLTRHAASQYGAKATGVTLSVEGAAWCNQENEKEKLTKEVDILCMDYREIPTSKKFNKIASIEMAEHVGLQNFQLYLNGVKDLLDDDGIFLMQVAGLRQGASWQDIAWGLFMSKYIFPGADASTPLHWYINQCEIAGFEVHSVETIGRHYSHTIHKWYDNWMSNRDTMEPKYSSRLFNLWEIFLAWSVIAAGQGSATCYQITMHKNTYDYPRDRWCNGEKALGERK
ncbi:Sphingolipid C9-methyltransferase 2 [Diplonema papillatum]|nr:Sphingolipid C9-methyltransferase 2 [Diplonema papillatum]